MATEIQKSNAESRLAKAIYQAKEVLSEKEIQNLVKTIVEDKKDLDKKPAEKKAQVKN